MQKFFFQLKYPDDLLKEGEAAEFPNLEAAKAETVQSICDLAAQSLASRQKFSLVSIRVCDAEGRLLCEVFSKDAISEILPSLSVGA